jgi:hypothetical protein
MLILTGEVEKGNAGYSEYAYDGYSRVLNVSLAGSPDTVLRTRSKAASGPDGKKDTSRGFAAPSCYPPLNEAAEGGRRFACPNQAVAFLASIEGGPMIAVGGFWSCPATRRRAR